MKNSFKKNFFLGIILFFLSNFILALPIMNKNVNTAVVVKKMDFGQLM